MNTGKNRGSIGLMILFAIIAIYAVYMYTNSTALFSHSSSQASFEDVVGEGGIKGVEIVQEKEIPAGYVVYTINGTSYMFYVSDVNDFQDYCKENNIAYVLSDVQHDSYVLTTIVPVVLIIVAIAFLFLLIVNGTMLGMGGGGAGAQGDKMMSFGKSHARKADPAKEGIGFSSVAGLKEEKEDLAEIVDFLKSPEKYTQMGARIPKGVLLEGPPGTGKTLLAKAVSGEAGVPFYSISGSDFVEMFVGVGASRVRDLFDTAKKDAPCIIFIDEIDAVAKRRGTGMGGGHDEKEQTLNQLLVEMDGFNVNEGIIVMAATNRVDILDPAILRPGRFDRKIVVGRPDVSGREEILKVHAANKRLSDDVDLEKVARTTAGYTGADLENLMNEAAIAAAKDNRQFISQTDIDKSFVKVSIGTEKHSRIISDREKRITAYHESGHAILFHVLPLMESVHSISIIPTGPSAAGYTMPLPEKDDMFMSREKLLQHIEVCLGGRIAEELIFEDVTTGASQDIKSATNAARAMVTQYGMSEELGLINYGSDDEEVFIGRDMARTKAYSEKTAAQIDDEVKRIMKECYDKAKAIIVEHEDVLHRSAALLLEKEKISSKEFEDLFA